MDGYILIAKLKVSKPKLLAAISTIHSNFEIISLSINQPPEKTEAEIDAEIDALVLAAEAKEAEESAITQKNLEDIANDPSMPRELKANLLGFTGKDYFPLSENKHCSEVADNCSDSPTTKVRIFKSSLNKLSEASEETK